MSVSEAATEEREGHAIENKRGARENSGNSAEEEEASKEQLRLALGLFALL